MYTFPPYYQGLYWYPVTGALELLVLLGMSYYLLFRKRLPDVTDAAVLFWVGFIAHAPGLVLALPLIDLRLANLAVLVSDRSPGACSSGNRFLGAHSNVVLAPASCGTACRRANFSGRLALSSGGISNPQAYS